MEVLQRIGGRLRGLLGGEAKITSPESALDAVEIDGLLAQCHRVFPAELESPWAELAGRSPAATTFVSPLWQQGGVGPRLVAGALRFFTVRRGDDLLAAIPMELKPGGFLESAGYAVSDYLDPLTSGADDPAIWAALLQLFDRLWDRNLKAITFQNVREASAARAILSASAGGHGLACEETVTSNAARIQLPSTWEAYLESLDAHERKELRRKIRKAQTQAAGHLQVLDASNATQSHIASALDLIEAADESKREWLQLNVRPLLTRIGLDLVRQGRMRLLMLMLNGAPAACLIDFPSKAGPLLYNSGFDPAQRQWSPGAVTFGLAIKDAIERGARVFDMLRGQESYKYKLGAQDSPVYRLVLHR